MQAEEQIRVKVQLLYQVNYLQTDQLRFKVLYKFRQVPSSLQSNIILGRINSEYRAKKLSETAEQLFKGA
jgi:hypothetical protein